VWRKSRRAGYLTAESVSSVTNILQHLCLKRRITPLSTTHARLLQYCSRAIKRARDAAWRTTTSTTWKIELNIGRPLVLLNKMGGERVNRGLLTAAPLSYYGRRQAAGVRAVGDRLPSPAPPRHGATWEDCIRWEAVTCTVPSPSHHLSLPPWAASLLILGKYSPSTSPSLLHFLPATHMHGT